jgi:hypothetical protein
MVREDYVEPDSTFFYSLTLLVNRVLSDRYYKNNSVIKQIESELENYKGFIKRVHQENLFNQYMYEIVSKHNK